MKKILEPKKQYFLIPLTYVYICVIAMVNYMLWKNFSKAIKTLILVLLASFVFFIAIPLVLITLGLPDIFESKFFIFYFYTISTIISIFLIKGQQDYIKSIDGQNK